MSRRSMCVLLAALAAMLACWGPAAGERACADFSSLAEGGDSARTAAMLNVLRNRLAVQHQFNALTALQHDAQLVAPAQECLRWLATNETRPDCQRNAMHASVPLDAVAAPHDDAIFDAWAAIVRRGVGEAWADAGAICLRSYKARVACTARTAAQRRYVVCYCAPDTSAAPLTTGAACTGCAGGACSAHNLDPCGQPIDAWRLCPAPPTPAARVRRDDPAPGGDASSPAASSEGGGGDSSDAGGGGGETTTGGAAGAAETPTAAAMPTLLLMAAAVAATSAFK